MKPAPFEYLRPATLEEALAAPGDIHGSGDYRRRLARTLVQRGLAEAAQMVANPKSSNGGRR